MAFLFFMTLPGLVVLLTVAALVDQVMLRAGMEGGTGVLRIPGADSAP
ncbi:hypothetical protein [Streptomyces sp. H39-S7]|nr:hypothetical protein [Streptomyces sp. H39-S7]MCZ4123915.1 hypothetical protein [Streptomyces sp. H39-S7]